jgi:GntR family transcriptional regulator
MKMSLDPQSPVPLHAQLSEQIHLAIARGELAPGAQLPTVRQLSVALKINSNTVARVYAELERAGVVHSWRGRGTFVAERPRVSSAARERRLDALCRSFVKACSEEGFSLAEIRAALEDLETGRRRT